MIILEEPYVSDFLIETIKKNNFRVLDNEIARRYFKTNELVNIKNIDEAELFYTNSENSIDLIFENMNDSKLASMIQLSKDKIAFRKALKNVYPDYYFKEITLDEIYNLDENNLKYPFILKPSVGFLSFGVYSVKSKEEFVEVKTKIKSDLDKIKDVFPLSVVDCSKFIMEELIEGDEYALDAYFDKNGKATILNIFHHPFFDENDVSDRLYYTSKEIIEKYLDKFEDVLNKIAVAGNYRNFPFHLELRAQEDKIIPIELNPLRFCGWCITDIAQYAWGINVYEYYMQNKKPDWKNILNNSSDDYFYFTIGDIPSSIDKKDIKNIKYDKYLENISNPLDIRKIDYKTKPVFAIVFAKTSSINEMKDILKLDMTNFVEMEKR